MSNYDKIYMKHLMGTGDISYALKQLYTEGTEIEPTEDNPLIEGRTGPFEMKDGAIKYFNNETRRIEEGKKKDLDVDDDGDVDSDDYKKAKDKAIKKSKDDDKDSDDKKDDKDSDDKKDDKDSDDKEDKKDTKKKPKKKDDKDSDDKDDDKDSDDDDSDEKDDDKDSKKDKKEDLDETELDEIFGSKDKYWGALKLYKEMIAKGDTKGAPIARAARSAGLEPKKFSNFVRDQGIKIQGSGLMASAKTPLAEYDAVDATVFSNLDNTENLEDEKDRRGIKQAQEAKLKTPPEVIKAIDTRIKEVQASIDQYDNKGYNDEGIKPNVIEVLKKLKEHLKKGDYESFVEAQIFFQTLMSPIPNMLPSKLINFLARGAEKNKYDYMKDYK